MLLDPRPQERPRAVEDGAPVVESDVAAPLLPLIGPMSYEMLVGSTLANGETALAGKQKIPLLFGWSNIGPM